MSENGWSEHKIYVTKELESQKKTNGEQWDEISKLKTEMAVLKVKSGIWGAIGAGSIMLLGIVAYLVRFLIVSG